MMGLDKTVDWTDQDIRALVANLESVDLDLTALNSSKVRFVRSINELGLADALATGGEWVTPQQALRLSHGRRETLLEAVRDGQASLPVHGWPPGVVADRARTLGLTAELLAETTRLPLRDVEQCLDADAVPNVRALSTVARVLGIDGASFDPAYGLEFFTAFDAKPLLPPRDALVCLDVASTVDDINRLRSWRGVSAPQQRTVAALPHAPVDSSNTRGQAIRLARSLREWLDLSPTQPIQSMVDVYHRLGFPVVAADLPPGHPSMAVRRRTGRGVAVQRAFATPERQVDLRFYLAHELCHLIWDPDDVYLVLEAAQAPNEPTNDVAEWLANLERTLAPTEVRATLFATELLLPGAATVPTQPIDGLVTRYGVTAWHAALSVLLAVGDNRATNQAVGDGFNDDLPVFTEALPVVFHHASIPLHRRGQLGHEAFLALNDGTITRDSFALFLRYHGDELDDVERACAEAFGMTES
jgi:hypothetical protein